MKNAKTPKTPKTTQGKLKDAVDSFLYRYDWLTGGTREETIRQAPSGLIGLEEMAAKVATMAANPNKIAAANAHLMDYALRMVPLKLSIYRKNVPGTPEFEAYTEAVEAQKAADRAAFLAMVADFESPLPANVLVGVFGK